MYLGSRQTSILEFFFKNNYRSNLLTAFDRMLSNHEVVIIKQIKDNSD